MNIANYGKRRSAVSPVIATLLLIAIAVAAAIIVYAFVTGLIGGLSSGAGSTLITVSGGISVPSGTTTGTIVVTVKNGANNPITTITINPANSAPATLCAAACPVTLNYAGAAVAAGNPLPIGQTASGFVALNNANLFAGKTYTMTVTVTFSNGQQSTQNWDVTAQT